MAWNEAEMREEEARLGARAVETAPKGVPPQNPPSRVRVHRGAMHRAQQSAKADFVVARRLGANLFARSSHAVAPRSLFVRLALFIILGLLAIPLYQQLIVVAPVRFAEAGRLGWLLAGVTALSLGGAALVLASCVAPTRRMRLIELGVILGVGIVLRAVVFGSPPLYTADLYRYLWDAHLLTHGVSPYLHSPDDPLLAPLRDGFVWPRLNFRDAPTIYPPGAQGIFILAGLLKPLNITALKALIEVADLAVAVLLMVLLHRRGQDPRRVILYWWSPIPILEFALNGHIDVAAIAWTLAALLIGEQPWRGARGLAGVCLGLAALTKIYPLLFVIALARRRDRAFFAALLGTIVLAYLPILHVGLGGGGFLSAYFQQRLVDQGILQRWLGQVVTGLHGSAGLLTLLQLGLVAALSLAVGWWRWRRGLTPVAAILALSAVWMLLSPHLFPWYIGMVLPFVALELGGMDIYAIVAMWIFALMMPFTYVIFAPGYNAELFQLFFYIPFAVAAWPLIHSVLSNLSPRRRTSWRSP